MANVKVLLFAGSREAAGLNKNEISICMTSIRDSSDEGHFKLRNLVRYLLELYPGLNDVLDSCVITVNMAYVDLDAEIAPDDEIAIIPPVSGG